MEVKIIVQENSLHTIKLDGGYKTRRTSCLRGGADIPILSQRDAVSLWQLVSNAISIPGRRFPGAYHQNESIPDASGWDVPQPLRQLLIGHLLRWQSRLLLPSASSRNHQITIKEVHPHVHQSLSSMVS
jgi:hypothetical protein